jgi:hypothetical protein
VAKVAWKGSALIVVELRYPPASVTYSVNAGRLNMIGLFTGPEAIWNHVRLNAMSLSKEQKQDISACMGELFPHFHV